MEATTESIYKVRTARLEDAHLLAELGAKTFYDTYASHNKEEDINLYLESTFTKDKIVEELNDKSTTFIIASVNDIAGGYAKLIHNHLPQQLNGKKGLEISRIYVTESLIGKKVGKALMKHCLETAQQGKYDLLWLGVWGKNERAVGFYEKFGFEKIGDQPFLLGKDEQTDCVMVKYLV